MGRTKLDADKARAIRSAYSSPDGPSMGTLARTYGVTVGTIQQIIHHKIWANTDTEVSPEKLHPSLRTPYILARKSEDVPVPVIARELGISASAVYARLAKAGA